MTIQSRSLLAAFTAVALVAPASAQAVVNPEDLVRRSGAQVD